MQIIELVIIALALSMDAFAVSASNAVSHHDAPLSQLLLMPVLFGIFQGLMPLIGYFAGSLAASLIEQYAGIVAFLILAFIGGRMVLDGLKQLWSARRDQQAPSAGPTNAAAADHSQITALTATPAASPGPLTLSSLFGLAIATSIDAFVIGVSFVAMNASIWLAAPLITVITAVCCLAALWLGKRFGTLLGDRAVVVGGLVLVAIGVNALLG